MVRIIRRTGKRYTYRYVPDPPVYEINLDKPLKSCSQCRYSRANKFYEKRTCLITGKDVTHYLGTIHPDCKLKECTDEQE